MSSTVFKPLYALLLTCWLLFPNPALAALTNQDSPLAVLSNPNHFILLRHALAPGTGDPASFDLNDCRTQRNLSEAGREQAREIGERLRRAGITKATVFSSQWCRCLETADLLNLGPVTKLPALNSFYQAPETRSTRLKQFATWLEEHPLEGPTILVTHQVTISALTREFTGSGDGVIVQHLGDGKLQVVGKFRAP
ncbi:MAG: histidine phosphatase family protein [Puniceicoccaceae bacterium]